jgi:hypothetical protein
MLHEYDWRGLWCQGCEEHKPDVRLAVDVMKYLCNLCWVDDAPVEGVQRSGFKELPDEPPEDEESSDA